MPGKLQKAQLTLHEPLVLKISVHLERDSDWASVVVPADPAALRGGFWGHAYHRLELKGSASFIHQLSGPQLHARRCSRTQGCSPEKRDPARAYPHGAHTDNKQ